MTATATSLRALRRDVPATGATTRICQRDDDDIDHFGKCITAVSRISSSAPGLFIAPWPNGFKSQLLSVMELRTVVTCGARSFRAMGRGWPAREQMWRRGEEPREEANAPYIEHDEDNSVSEG